MFLIPNLAHGGAEKVLVNLVNNLDKTKYDVTVQTLFDVGVNRKNLSDSVHYIGGFKKMPRGNTLLMKLFSPKTLFKHIIKDKYDLIISFLEGPTARIVSGCSYNAKLVSWIHIEQFNKKIASRNFRSYAEALECYNKFDLTVCVSKGVRNDFLSLFRLNCNVEVIYNTNESEKICELANEKVADLDFDTSLIRVVSVAKVVHSKGFDRLIRIHKRLRDEGYTKHIIYVLGIGEEREKYERYLIENGLSESFIFLGYKNNPYKYVKNCDLYVCSSRKEGFSTAVTEALIVGTPVVSTDCSGAKELLGENNEFGIVTENDEEALYQGIKTLLSDPDLLGEYKKKAIERGKLFNTKATVHAVEDMLDSL